MLNLLELKNIKDVAIRQEREKIKTDLLKIADEGEYEDLRREVEIYFTNLTPKGE